MLICHNCSTVQEDGVDRCRHCQMPGQLVPWNGTVQAAPAKPFLSHLCVNCGYETSGHEERCIECHFPLPVNRQKAVTTHAENEAYRRHIG